MYDDDDDEWILIKLFLLLHSQLLGLYTTHTQCGERETDIVIWRWSCCCWGEKAKTLAAVCTSHLWLVTSLAEMLGQQRSDGRRKDKEGAIKPDLRTATLNHEPSAVTPNWVDTQQHWLTGQEKESNSSESQFNDNQFRFSYYYSISLFVRHKQRSLLPVFLVYVYTETYN
jgi:hypothetical protein